MFGSHGELTKMADSALFVQTDPLLLSDILIGSSVLTSYLLRDKYRAFRGVHVFHLCAGTFACPEAREELASDYEFRA